MAARSRILWLAVGSAVLAAVPGTAQVRSAPRDTTAQIQARHEIAALEGVLENAVRYGGQMLSQQLQGSNTPDMIVLAGIAHARGFRLDGYGVLFDVEFPSIRRSVMWSMRELQRPDPELLAAMQELRKNLQSVSDPRVRQELERAIKDLEAQLKAIDGQARTQQRPSAIPASAATAPSDSAASPATASSAAIDPRRVYFTEITNALIDAMLDHGAPLRVAPDEWLTIAARESDTRRFVADNPNDTTTTLILRIKGRDLDVLRDQHLPREEARKRVEIKEY